MHWTKHISKYGYATIKVMSEERATYFLKQLESFIKLKNIPINGSNTNGIIKSYGIGQSKFMWEMRKMRTIKRVFAQLCNCKQKDLLSSMDGAGYVSKVSDKAVYNLWPHRDQSPHNNDPETYQSLVNLSVSDGCFVCWPKSHLLKWTDPTLSNHAFFRIPNNDKNITIDNSKQIHVKPGTMIIWDSRLVHCNQMPVEQVPRAVAYICMVNGLSVSNDIIKKRQFCMDNNKTTSHHPIKFTIND
jgi:hypothetical protein